MYMYTIIYIYMFKIDLGLWLLLASFDLKLEFLECSSHLSLLARLCFKKDHMASYCKV